MESAVKAVKTAMDGEGDGHRNRSRQCCRSGGAACPSLLPEHLGNLLFAEPFPLYLAHAVDSFLSTAMPVGQAFSPMVQGDRIRARSPRRAPGEAERLSGPRARIDKVGPTRRRGMPSVCAGTDVSKASSISLWLLKEMSGRFPIPKQG